MKAIRLSRPLPALSIGRRRRWRIPVEMGLWLAGTLLALPALLIVLTAFKPPEEILRFGGMLPQRWTWANFEQILLNVEESPIALWLFNSLFVSTAETVLIVGLDSLAAYGLSRMRWRGGKWLLALMVATMMVPRQILLVPNYLLLDRMGLIDTLWALILPAGGGAFGVFLLHQFFQGIPRDVEEAAVIDGCSRLGVYWHIMLPMSRPMLAALAVYTFVLSWNNFLSPLVYLDSLDRFTLPVGIALFQSSYMTDYGITLAACVLALAPVLVAYLLFHRLIIGGMTHTDLYE
jgi:multiple sugar transport system permease protein